MKTIEFQPDLRIESFPVYDLPKLHTLYINKEINLSDITFTFYWRTLFPKDFYFRNFQQTVTASNIDNLSIHKDGYSVLVKCNSSSRKQISLADIRLTYQ